MTGWWSKPWYRKPFRPLALLNKGYIAIFSVVIVVRRVALGLAFEPVGWCYLRQTVAALGGPGVGPAYNPLPLQETVFP